MKYLFLITAIWSVLTAAAQKPAGAGESKKMIEQVCAAAGKMQTLQCDFRQEKRLSLLETNMVSTGKMYYKGGKALKWEYVSPYAYTFLLNGDKVMLGSQGKTDVIQVNSSKTFKQIARIMMHSITGKCLSDTEDFHVTMLVEGNEWIAELIPRQKELAQLDKNLAGYAAKLSNAAFVERAPAKVVEEEKKRQADALANKAKVEAALKRIANF